MTALCQKIGHDWKETYEGNGDVMWSCRRCQKYIIGNERDEKPGPFTEMVWDFVEGPGCLQEDGRFGVFRGRRVERKP